MDTALLPYRLKSARRKKRLQREDRDKQLLKMEREYDRLENLKRELPYVPLDEPYQRGWMRLWVLKPEVAKSENAEFYQQIVDKLTEIQYHYDESFKKPRRKGRRHRYYFDGPPKLRAVSKYKWEACWHNFTDEQRALFRIALFWDETYDRWDHHYVFTEPELFEIVVRPRMIYEVRMHDDELEREMAFIDDRLYSGPNWYRLLKLEGGRYKNWYSKVFPEKPKYRNPLKNKPLYMVLDECGYVDDFMPVVDDYGHNCLKVW